MDTQASPHLHGVQILALEGHVGLIVHGDHQRTGVQELWAVVLLGEHGWQGVAPVATPSPQPIPLAVALTMWARTMPSSGLGEASRHSW